MNEREIETLFHEPESDRVEWKPVFRSKTGNRDFKDEICKTICAFANNLPNHPQPSVLFIGRDDQGKCANLSVTDELLREISQIRSDGKILPLPMLQVRKQVIDGCELAVILVEPTSAPPVRYMGEVYVRVGPTTRRASFEEELHLAERRAIRDFDIHPVPSATLDDLDLTYFREEYLPNAIARSVLQENNRPIERQLTSLRLLATDNRTPTVLGLLVIGKDPRYFLPGSYIQFLRIDGTNLGDPVKDQEEISGRLSTMLGRIEDKLLANISIATDLSGAVEIQRPDYPFIALREFIRNAVLHRDYCSTNAPVRVYWFNDRIEINSPGSPFGNVTQANFGKQGVTDYRNPHLAEVMKNLGYVQRFGYGIPLSEKNLRENDNPEPLYTIEMGIPGFVLVTVRKRP